MGAAAEKSGAPLPAKLAGLLREAKWLILVALAAYLSLIFATYHRSDPSWSHSATHAVPGNAGQLGALHAAGVVGVKCFLLPSGVDEFPPLDAAELRAAMGAVAAVDGLLIAHAEDPDVIAAAPPSGR